ncbi:MAG TPA: DUF1501 domain-containing protein [Blastocatellia bacterium]|nr:DUF1501 domain-containing protein [Blastocatellia bacterium]
MPITRRQFIKRAAGAVTVGVIIPRYLTGTAGAQQLSLDASRKLVIIQLAGGNDGLNTVVPYTDSRYHALRPILGFNENELRTPGGESTVLNGQFGLHPSMGQLKTLYDQGKVGIVLGVGYPNPNLSHFLSMDIWHTADPTGTTRVGWLGKYADIAFVGQPGLRAAAFGTLELPKTLNANRYVVPTIINYQFYNFITDPAYPGDSANQLTAFNAAASRNFSGDSFLSHINTDAQESVKGVQTVQQAIGGYSSTVQYPSDNPLAGGLKMVAQLVTTLPEAQVLYVLMSGFDHHSDQIARPGGTPDKTQGQHAVLLRWFSEAVKLFYDDMTEHGLAEQVLLMQWSEFGRRPAENASFGTDHGTAAPMFIIGNQVSGGLHGQQPSLLATDLDSAGNVTSTADFRQVYAEILDRWLGVDSREVLGSSYDRIGFLS